MIFFMRAFVFYRLAFATGTFSPELGMLLAESLVNVMVPEPRSYAGLRTLAGATFFVNATADRFQAEPLDFANRLHAIRQYVRDTGTFRFHEDIEKFNTTCINPTNVTAHYTVSDLATTAIAQAGVLSAIMSMRASVCGYTSDQLVAFTRGQVRDGKAQLEVLLAGLKIETDAVRCWFQRLDDAIRRLGESTDPLSMGFLTLDTCLNIQGHIVPRDPVTIAVSEPLNYFDPGMVDVSYPARNSYQTGNFSRAAWLIDTPAEVSYASVWFNFIKGGEQSQGKWDLFSITDSFNLRLERNRRRDRLVLSNPCGGQLMSGIDFPSEPGWHFVSVAVYGNVAIIRYDELSWRVRVPVRAACEDASASLGPRLDAPLDGEQAENAIIRFYDFKVSSEPAVEGDMLIKRNHLRELGTDTPIVCNTRNGFERRDGLKACYPGPVVRIQYVYDAQAAPVIAADEAASADVYVAVDVEESQAIAGDDDLAFGQREFLIFSGIVLLSSLLLVTVCYWLLARQFERKLAELNQQAEALLRQAQEIKSPVSSGSPAQASASGGLQV